MVRLLPPDRHPPPAPPPTPAPQRPPAPRPAGSARNATAATAANPAAQASIAEYPNFAIVAPPASEATNCAANDTSIIRAAAPVRSCSRTRSISSVLTPGSVIHWQDV